MSVKVKKRLTHAERADNLVAAGKAYLQAVVLQSNDPVLPRETTPDEYIAMCMAITRAQRKAITGPGAKAIIDLARAIHVAECGEVAE